LIELQNQFDKESQSILEETMTFCIKSIDNNQSEEMDNVMLKFLLNSVSFTFLNKLLPQGLDPISILLKRSIEKSNDSSLKLSKWISKFITICHWGEDKNYPIQKIINNLQLIFQVDSSLENYLHDWIIQSVSNLCLILSFAEENSTLFSLAKKENAPVSLNLQTVYVNHALASLLKNCDQLTSLELKCSIGNEGAISIAESLKLNQSLHQLNLKNNQIGKEGCTAIAESLKLNKSLQQLNLGMNQIGKEGAIAIAESLKLNQSLQQLNLEINQFGNEGAIAIAESLKINQSLQQLSLGNNGVGYEGNNSIVAALKVNHTVKVVK